MKRTHFLRRPKGFRNAAKNKVKSTKAPPTAWDDLPNNKSVAAWSYGERLFLKAKTFNKFFRRFQVKFPSFSKEEIREIFYWVKSWEKTK
jgi:hypothetical protein